MLCSDHGQCVFLAVHLYGAIYEQCRNRLRKLVPLSYSTRQSRYEPHALKSETSRVSEYGPEPQAFPTGRFAHGDREQAASSKDQNCWLVRVDTKEETDSHMRVVLNLSNTLHTKSGFVWFYFTLINSNTALEQHCLSIATPPPLCRLLPKPTYYDQLYSHGRRQGRPAVCGQGWSRFRLKCWF